MTEISKEYAEALFSIACEQNEEKNIMTVLEDISLSFTENADFMEFLSSPGISLKERLNFIENVFSSHYPEYVISFLQLLCEKGRIKAFPECIKAYRQLLNIRQSTTVAKVTSAISLSDGELQALKQKLEKISGNTVTLDCSIDEALLGGVIVEMNGTVMDGSLRHRLHEVKDVMNR